MRTRKNLVTFVLVVLIGFGAFSSISIVKSASDAPQIQWQKSLLGEVARSVVQTADGGYLILASERSTSYGEGSSLPLVSLTSLLIRTDAQGNVLWQNNLQVGDVTNFNYLISTNESFLTNNSIPTTNGIPASSGIALAGVDSNSTYLVSLDSGGNVQWSQVLNGTYGGYVSSMVQTIDGGFALVGTYYSNIAPSAGQIWCIKTDEYGNETWNETIGSLGESASAIVQSADGGYAIIATETVPGSSQEALEIIKLDPTGAVEWTKTYPGPVQGSIQWAASSNDGIITQDGGYLIAGMLSIPNSQNGPTYAWLVKTDSLGNLEWNKTVGIEGGYASSIVQAVDGGYAFSGTLGNQVAWVAKTDAAGSMEWNSTFPSVSIITPGETLIQTNDTGYVLAGAANDTVCLVKLSPDTSGSNIPLSNRAIIVIGASAGGTTNPVPGTYICNASTQVSLLAKPAAGHKFDKWVSGTQEFTFNPLIFTTKNGTYDIQAVFVATNESSQPTLSNFASFFSSPPGAAVAIAVVLGAVIIFAAIFQRRRTQKNTSIK